MVMVAWQPFLSAMSGAPPHTHTCPSALQRPPSVQLKPLVPTLPLPLSASFKTQPVIAAVGSPVLPGLALKEQLELVTSG